MALLCQAPLPSAPHTDWRAGSPAGPPSEWCSHNQTTNPAMAGVGTGMSVDTPGTSRVIIGDKRLSPSNSNHQQAPTGELPSAVVRFVSPHPSCFALWDRSSLRPSQADCHHIAATIASNSGELGSVASSGLAQGRLESICILWPGLKTPPGLC